MPKPLSDEKLAEVYRDAKFITNQIARDKDGSIIGNVDWEVAQETGIRTFQVAPHGAVQPWITLGKHVPILLNEISRLRDRVNTLLRKRGGK